MNAVQQDNDVIEVSQSRVLTTQIGITATDLVVIHTMLWADGDDFCSFVSSLISVDGVVQEFPVVLPAGAHVLQLVNDQFHGTNLMLVGGGMNSITDLALGNVSSIAMDTVLQQLALKPDYLEIDGAPADSEGKSGDRRYDRVNKIRYYKAENEWRQER